MTVPDAPGTPGTDLSLRLGAKEMARYRDGQDMAGTLSPRPYLHPVTTAAGIPLTEILPEDHTHHHGVSNAVVEVNGTMFWGGKSYVHPSGYEMLANHGRQVPGRTEATDHRITQELQWVDPNEEHVLTEERTILADLMPAEDAWALRWHSRMHADGGHDLTIGSPATRGRTGAGYGGVFWRVSAEQVPTTAHVASGGDPLGDDVSPWLLLVQQRETGPVSLLLGQPRTAILPWFVRTTGYVGAGPAAAWQEPRTVAAGAHLDLHLWGVLADRALTPSDAAVLYERLELLP
ncbi:PmoA family protein [Ruania alba]|uniref:Methane oxygenase PmoA n=1 Tax=Ruania alba TaxID=648782 RepID=A0A1H5HET1_9MICO|nr:PmoA family protein [Ruania alba]SEE26513.1 Methane oxygenase PmoA [Ruania alba]